jgi:hypothetical protein
MKKFLLVVCFTLLFPLAHAETIDMNKYTDQQLIDLQSKIMLELSTRSGAKNIEIPAGTYIAGIDFPSGTYSVQTKGIFVQFVVYQNKNDMKSVLEQTDDFIMAFSRSKQHIIDEENGIGKIEIEDGNVLNIIGGTVFLTPYAGLKIN